MDKGDLTCQFVKLKAVINGVLEAKLILPVCKRNNREKQSVQADIKKPKEEDKMKKPTKKKGSRGGRRG
jgi:hypothetical protein